MKRIISFLITAARPSTARAVAGITKALDQLNEVVAYEERKIDLIDVRIEVLEQEQDEAATRRDNAAKIAKRFAKLVA